MSISIELKSGEVVEYCNGALAAAVIQWRDPAIFKGSLNGAEGTKYNSLTVYDTDGTAVRFADSDAAYLPDGYKKLVNTTSVQDVYDDIVALTETDEVLPTNSSTLLNNAYPFRVAVIKDSFQVLSSDRRLSYKSLDRNTHVMTLSGNHRFYFIETNQAIQANGTDKFELTKTEYTGVKTLLDGLC